jgi:hypothetical protein
VPKLAKEYLTVESRVWGSRITYQNKSGGLVTARNYEECREHAASRGLAGIRIRYT